MALPGCERLVGGVQRQARRAAHDHVAIHTRRHAVTARAEFEHTPKGGGKDASEKPEEWKIGSGSV